MDKSLIAILQAYFIGQPVSKVWLFGSRSRGDNREDSDFDILVDFDNNVGLFKYASMVGELENILHKGVDLVSETAIFPWVKDNINNDKQLIYDRKA